MTLTFLQSLPGFFIGWILWGIFGWFFLEGCSCKGKILTKNDQAAVIVTVGEVEYHMINIQAYCGTTRKNDWKKESQTRKKKTKPKSLTQSIQFRHWAYCHKGQNRVPTAEEGPVWHVHTQQQCPFCSVLKEKREGIQASSRAGPGWRLENT